MWGFNGLGKVLIFLGMVFIALGLLLIFNGRIPFLGRLPGDIYIQRKNLSIYFPLATSLLISLVLSLALWLWSRK